MTAVGWAKTFKYCLFELELELELELDLLHLSLNSWL